MPPVPSDPPELSHFLFTEHAPLLDRYEALQAEDQAMRAEQYERPDPKRRRLRVMCNGCDAPFCCNHRVDLSFIEALGIYRYAARHAKRELETAIVRTEELRQKKRSLECDDWFRRRVPCAFLVKGRCAIYPVRPHACRTHYMAGNPSKCRDELSPSETYAMDPDATVIAEQARLDDELRFFTLIAEVGETELGALLSLVRRVTKLPPWKTPRALSLDDVPG